MSWLAENLGTIVVSAILIVMVISITRGLKKKACRCNCAHCSLSCHKKQTFMTLLIKNKGPVSGPCWYYKL